MTQLNQVTSPVTTAPLRTRRLLPTICQYPATPTARWVKGPTGPEAFCSPQLGCALLTTRLIPQFCGGEGGHRTRMEAQLKRIIEALFTYCEKPHQEAPPKKKRCQFLSIHFDKWSSTERGSHLTAVGLWARETERTKEQEWKGRESK